jgi:mannose/fructose/N-acetylgalactosamine-specific phosphotransferase system component IIB
VTVVLARVDERLVHGQVTVGWVPALDVRRIVVADDVIGADVWERDLIASAAPPGLAVEVLEIVAAAARLEEAVSERVLLLVRSPASMAALVRAGTDLAEVNLGGLHYREGARPFADYLWFTRDDIEALRELAGQGIRLVARDLPGNPARELNGLLAEGRLEYDQLPVRDS